MSPDVGDLKEFFDITHESTQVGLNILGDLK